MPALSVRVIALSSYGLRHLTVAAETSLRASLLLKAHFCIVFRNDDLNMYKYVYCSSRPTKRKVRKMFKKFKKLDAAYRAEHQVD